MKNKSLIGLVILMGFSLFGIIMVQFFWMNNAIKVQKEKFNATVYDALNATVQRVQREQAANYFIKQFLPPQSRQTQAQHITDPSKTNIIPHFPIPGKSQRNSPVLLSDEDTETLLPNIIGTFEAHIEIQNNGKSQQFVISKNNIDFTNENNIHEVEKAIEHMEDSLKMALKKNSNLGALNFFNQFSYEFDMRSSDASNRIDEKNLTKTLDYELNARGIDLAYEYAILNRKDGTLTSLSSNTYQRKNSDFDFLANLFPDDLFRSWSPLAIDIYFPNEEIFIYKSLNFLLGSSFLFTLFILITFFFTLRTILNQKKLSEIKSDFINNMTHEFKTPIATINLAADNIANPMIIEKPENITPFIRIIKEENKRMNNQVERVLQMSLIEKGDFQLVPVKVDLNNIINNAVGKIKLLGEQKSATINTNLKADLTIFNVDEVHFTNVVLNLLENALKYTSKKPEIDITTENNNNGIEISITDNGIGMTKEQQSKVFEKFFRATRGNIHNVKGFGLGLSYVKAIMVQHNGNVFVKSKPGEGSTFKLFLPYSE